MHFIVLGNDYGFTIGILVLVVVWIIVNKSVSQLTRYNIWRSQSFHVTHALLHANRLPVTIQYPYEKLITSERFRGRIHFEFDKCIACEVCVRVCPMDLPVVDWELETNIRKKSLLNYSIDFGI
uniref:4Fe-4S ferredoxin-type domain-containing protein n=1 Tax=Quercus lobata TaxID=97700 RepID=A0A7N2N895_QUELO